MTTLYVTDLDGTLLNNGSFVSANSSGIISELSDDGALITVATARTPATVVPIMDGTFTNVPFVVMTGAATYDRVTGAYRNLHVIPDKDVALLRRIFADNEVNPFIYHYIDNRELVVYHDRDMTQREYDFYYERRNLKLKRFTFENILPANSDQVLLFFAVGPRDNIIAIADEIDRSGQFSVSCYPDIFAAGIYMLEVFTRGVSKAEAILLLKKQVGADRLVTFGDNLNDIPMMAVSDLAVAVDNAQPQVKDAADIIIGPNYDDAVARFIYDDFHGIC